MHTKHKPTVDSLVAQLNEVYYSLEYWYEEDVEPSTLDDLNNVIRQVKLLDVPPTLRSKVVKLVRCIEAGNLYEYDEILLRLKRILIETEEG